MAEPQPDAPEPASDDQSELRRRAEKTVARRTEHPEGASVDRLEELIHELEVHQVELEMQNESLRATQAELEASRNRYADLYDFAPVGYMTLDGQGQIREINLTATIMLGVERKWLAGHPLARFIEARSHKALRGHIGRLSAAEPGEELTLETTLRPRGRPPVPVQLRTVAVDDSVSGDRVYRMAIVDLSELRRSQAARQESEERLRLALDGGRMGLWVWNLEANTATWNRREFELLGLPPADGPVDPGLFFARVHPDDIAALRRRVDDVRASGENLACETRVVWPDGEVHWLAVAGRVYREDAGRPVRIAGVNFDITEQKETEGQLHRLTESLEELVAERTAEVEARAGQLRLLAAELTRAEERERQRLARVLHDHLQQLLVAAKLKVGVLLRVSSDAELQRPLVVVKELLDESISASRSLTAELSPPMLYDAGLVPTIRWLARQRQRSHGLQVEVEAADGVAPIAEAPRVLLFQAVGELLLNVVKHAGVESARVEVRPLDGDRVQVVVSDRGQGFDPEQVRRQRTADTGLGLFSIGERLEVIGGRMEIDSAPGRGTRVTLVAPRRMEEVEVEERIEAAVPRRRRTARPAQTAGSAEPGAIRVLLADDHPILRQGLADLLGQQRDVDLVGEAADGFEAVELARQLHPQVVLMDVTMPRLDGVEATRLITTEMPDVRVIGLSMHDEQDMAAAMQAAGASAYVNKSGPLDALLASIRECAAGGDEVRG